MRTTVMIGTAFLLALVTSSLALAPTPHHDLPATSTSRNSTTITLTIDYRDGVQKMFNAVEFTPGLTVADAIGLAAKHPRGIKIVQSGSGATAFIKQIDDLKNQGSGQAARNWQFSVNGQLATKGAGATELKAGDAVVWAFDTYRPGVDAPAQQAPAPTSK